MRQQRSTVRFFDREKALPAGLASGRLLREWFGIPEDRILVLRTSEGVREIPEDREIELPEGAEIVDIPFHEYGMGAAVAERLEREVKALKAQYGQRVRFGYDPDLERWWVHLARFPLPRGWSEPTSPLLVLVEDRYPFVPPDGFFLRANLKNRFGRLPAHYYDYTAREPKLTAAGYGWFCLRLLRWRPGASPREADNLLKFFALIELALREAVR